MVLATLIDLDPLSTADAVAIASVIIAAIGVWSAACYAKDQIEVAQGQLKAAREQLEQQSMELEQQSQTTRGQFLLALHERFHKHEKIHLLLRNAEASFKWWSGAEPTGDEWAEVEAYMGLFERVWMLVKGKSIDIEAIERLYGYRIENIVINDKIRETKLEDKELAIYWVDFIELWRALDEAHKGRLNEPLCYSHPAPPAPYPNDPEPTPRPPTPPF
jgi:hypothetical protein